MNWYTQPYRLITLAFGIAALWYGSHVEQLMDWDVGVSLLMAGFTYLLMPVFNYYLCNVKTWLASFMILNFCVDTTYGMYWDYFDQSGVAIHWANYPASAMLFLLCWAVWCLVPELVEGRFKTFRAAYESLANLF